MDLNIGWELSAEYLDGLVLTPEYNVMTWTVLRYIERHLKIINPWE
jgi:hypothetical protein